MIDLFNFICYDYFIVCVGVFLLGSSPFFRLSAQKVYIIGRLNNI